MKTKNYNDLTEIEQELFQEIEKNAFYTYLDKYNNNNETEYSLNIVDYNTCANENTVIYDNVETDAKKLGDAAAELFIDKQIDAI